MFLHGHGRPGHRTPTFISWSQMRQRCLNPRHHAWAMYGGRGITICPAWDDFLVFLIDMGPRLTTDESLDRVDNDGHYEPGNCRWATKSQQTINRRPPSPAQLAQLVRARAARNVLPRDIAWHIHQARRKACRHANPEKYRLSLRRYHENHPERHAARRAVDSAIASGRLQSQPCERCNASKTQAHHDDYSEPLKVRWLCRPCHDAVHREIREVA